MSDFFLQRFFQPERMPIELSIVKELPVDVLSAEDAHRLEESFLVDNDDDMACAASARLWESLLEVHRIPFLMLRVADMRVALEQQSTAVLLYQELADIVDDEDFSNWVFVVKEIEEENAKKRVKDYLAATFFSPSQRWIPGTARQDPFPHFRLKRSDLEFARDEWSKVLGVSNSALENYLNMNCLETNEIEGTVMFNLSASTKLIEVGFYNEALPPIQDPLLGEVRNVVSALGILQDTRNALTVLLDMIKQGKDLVLTPEHILKLHKELMRTSKIMCLTRSSGARHLSYVNAGITRQTSRTNVMTRSINADNMSVSVQFCPFDQVDEELQMFCNRFNLLIKMVPQDMDPFAAAAWISHVFVTIHPFEDGNGRVSRLLASIPLLLNSLPPLNIPPELKDQYIDELNHVRANRPLNIYNELVQLFHSAVLVSLRNLEQFYERTK